jgi:ribosomal protein L9
MKHFGLLFLWVNFVKGQLPSLNTAFVPSSSPSSPGESVTKSCPTTSSYSKVRLIHGASPTIGRSGGPLLFAKKSKDTTVGKGGKIQVKLLKHVAGTGSAGDVIKVAPAFFMNKLQKTGSAVRITDEEVEKECAEKAQQDKEARESAHQLKEKIDAMTLVLSKKAGPDGQLFGGIGYKAIFSELEKEFPKGALGAKYIKITSVKDDKGELLTHDIKSVGDYKVTISLLKDVAADFGLTVKNE